MTRSSGTAGFTLIEATVALAIVAVVATAVLAQAGADIRAAGRAADATVAAELARDRLDRIRLLGGSAVPLPDSLRSGRFTAPWDRWVWTAATERRLEEPALVDVRVEVGDGAYRAAVSTRIYAPPRRDGRP